jgi:hypothetical protein
MKCFFSFAIRAVRDDEMLLDTTMNRLYVIVFLLVAGKASASGLPAYKGAGSGASKVAAGRSASTATKSGAKKGGSSNPAKAAPARVGNKSGVKSASTGVNGQVPAARRSVSTTPSSPKGIRRTVVREADNSVAVTNRAGHGYLQRRFSYHGQEIIHRTYFTNGTAHANIYQPSTYRGVALNIYVPSRYYAPAFYGWAYASWDRSIRYRWSYTTEPWFRLNANYFSPSPSYANASSWLTDDLLSSSLQDAYQEQADGGDAPTLADSAAAPVTENVKQAIADEIHQQIAAENGEALTATNSMPDANSGSVADPLSDGVAHVFVVSSTLTVTSGLGDCTITGGDVIQMRGAPADSATAASLIMLASKSQDCPRGDIISLQIADLQEMLNHMRESIDAGLADLQTRLGQGGLPAAPATAMNPPLQPAYAAIPLDSNVASILGQEAQQAQRTDEGAPSQEQPRPSKASRALFWGQVIGSALTAH